jgi:sortase A
MRTRIINLFSFLLIAGGAFLLFWGAGEYLASRTGQWQAARDFDRSLLTAPSLPPTAVMPPPQPGDTFAKLIIPRLDAELYVVEGDDHADLRRGPGHITGTALPGSAGNCIIAGHRDTHFRVLKDIRDGDDIVLETVAGQYLYRVHLTKVIPPTDTAVLESTQTPQLSLITCYPFYYIGSAPERFLVKARLAGIVRRTS